MRCHYRAFKAVGLSPHIVNVYEVRGRRSRSRGGARPTTCEPQARAALTSSASMATKSSRSLLASDPARGPAIQRRVSHWELPKYPASLGTAARAIRRGLGAVELRSRRHRACSPAPGDRPSPRRRASAWERSSAAGTSASPRARTLSCSPSISARTTSARIHWRSSTRSRRSSRARPHATWCWSSRWPAATSGPKPPKLMRERSQGARRSARARTGGCHRARPHRHRNQESRPLLRLLRLAASERRVRPVPGRSDVARQAGHRHRVVREHGVHEPRRLVPRGLPPGSCPGWRVPFLEDQMWADPDVDAATAWMIRLVDRPGLGTPPRRAREPPHPLPIQLSRDWPSVPRSASGDLRCHFRGSGHATRRPERHPGCPMN